MDFEWTEEQDMLRESVRRFVDENAPVDFVRDRWDDPAGVTPGAWKGLVDLGVTGLLIPETFGGIGLSVLDMGVVLEELGRVLHPGPVLSSALVATRLIAATGNEADCESWLPRLAAGEVRLTVALENGEDAIRADHANGEWRLSGQLAPVLDAAGCDAILVPARVEKSLRVFLIACDATGVALTPFDQVDGTRRLFRIGLNAAPAALLGDGCADSAIAEAKDLLAMGLVADAVGAAGRALELATEYAKEREQFGRPIGSFQSLQHLLVDMLRDIELARASVLYALWSADAATPDERRHSAAVAKAFAAEAFPGIGASAIQVFGGIGYTWEMDIHLYDKRLSSQALLGGDATHHLETLATIAID